MNGGEAETFGTLLRRHRQAAALSQEALAERARVSVEAVSKLERGKRSVPRLETVGLLTEALGLAGEERRAFLAAARPSADGAAQPAQTRLVMLPGGGAREAAQRALHRAGRRTAFGAEPAPSSAPSGPAAPPFVGRAAELRALEGHVGGADAPLLVLAGRPGIGKTRLLQEAARLGHAHGLGVLQGGCRQRGGQEPYAPLLDAVSRHLHALTPMQARAALEGCAWLVKLLPELAGGPIAPLPTGALAPEQERRLMFEAVTRFLSQAGGPAGTLLLLDDLQWAGSDALALLRTLVSDAPEGGLRVVGAYRDNEVDAAQPLAELLADLAARGLAAQGTLAPLPSEEATALLRALLPQDEEAAARARVVQRAGGVPFFLVSCAQALRQDGWPGEESGAGIPWDVAQSVRQRVAALPAETRSLLGVAAVAGREVARTMVARVAARPEQEVLPALEAACRAALVEEAGPWRYRFAHDLIREVVVADLSAARLVLLHREIAAALEQEVPAGGEPPVELLAYHYAQAEAWPQALDYLLRAGDKAAAAYANQDALDVYAQALEVCEKLGDGALRTAAAALQKRASVHSRIQNSQAEAADLERMRDIARRLGDRLLEGLALVYSAGAENGLETAEQTLQAALAIADEGYPEVRLEASEGLAVLRMVAGRLGEAEAMLRAAAEVAPQVRDATKWTRALAAHRNLLYNWAGRFDEAIVEVERARGAATSLEEMADLQLREALARGGKGDYQQALTVLTGGLATWERTGNAYLIGRALNIIGWLYGEIQNQQGALEWNTRGLTFALDHDYPYHEVENNARLNLGDALVGLGRLDEAEEQFQVVEHMVRHPRPREHLMLWRYAQRLFHSYGELWLVRGDVARALAYADECLQRAEQTNSRKNIVKGRRLRGQALLAQGKLAEAEQELARALELAQEVGNPPQLWKTHLALGDLYTAQGRAEEARAAYRAAMQVIEGVAVGLPDPSLRETFLTSAHVRHVRQLVGEE